MDNCHIKLGKKAQQETIKHSSALTLLCPRLADQADTDEVNSLWTTIFSIQPSFYLRSIYVLTCTVNLHTENYKMITLSSKGRNEIFIIYDVMMYT